jgi:hypothetical protein
MGVSEEFHHRTQLNDALIAFEHHLGLFQGVMHGQDILAKAAAFAGFKGLDVSC